MAVITIQRLAEECLKIISGGDINLATNVTFNELKIAVGQKANELLKTEYLSVNYKTGETIPNGLMVATYDGIGIQPYGKVGQSMAVLPINPIKLPRNMGVFSVYLTSNPKQEFIPLQMGQANLIDSQPLINDLLGQIGYEKFDLKLIFTKDLTLLYPGETLSCRLVVMDISTYGDYDPLPILPEMEWQIKQEVVKLYSGVGISDLLVDSTTKQQQDTPPKQQSQP